MKKRNWPLLISFCLAMGGKVTVVIVCFLIGFGLHTPVGKDALYVSLGLEILNLLAVYRGAKALHREKKHHQPSPRMLGFFRLALSIWCVGFLLLIAALIPVLAGVRPSLIWIRLPSVLGTVLCPLGWLGLLMAAHRHRQATLVLNETQNPVSKNK